MGWTMNFGAYPPHWEELPEQIAVLNDDGGWDAYILTSKATKLIREAKDDANWLNAELHGAELEAKRIVHCKDCKHFTIVDETPDMEYPIRGCWLLTWRYEDEEPQDEDGYCAWGERREA